ncbi:autotransporter outer membrane beta-barrel domain-containing protein, partial [Martelella alba]
MSRNEIRASRSSSSQENQALSKTGQTDKNKKRRVRWIASSILFQTTALAGTLAGVPLPFYSRGFYSRAYAQASCNPSSIPHADVFDGTQATTVYSCTIPSGSTITTPQYVYGGALTFYSNPYDYKTGYYWTPENGIPGLNISLTNDATIDITEAATVSPLISFDPPYGTNYFDAKRKQSDAIRVVSVGSNSDYYGKHNKNNGGDGGNITITNSGDITNTVGNGIYAVSAGGSPYDDANGGYAGTVTVTNSASISAANTAILAISRGGASANSGRGGTGQTVTITVTGDVETIASTVSGSGIFAASYGGNGLKSTGAPGLTMNGGIGGQAGTVSVTLGSSSEAFAGSITTTASGKIAKTWESEDRDSGAAITAISGGGWGLTTTNGSGVDFDGGDGADVTVLVYGTSATLLKTLGDNSDGILAASYGGTSQNGYDGGQQGGASGNVTVTLTGGGSIKTYGASSSGIDAVSLGGLGRIASQASSSNTGGTAGAVTVKNNFSITTEGSNSNGIVAISAGAGGGVYAWSGDSGFTWGDSNIASNTSSDVYVYNGGAIVTYGVDSHGIVAMSIGGGGGLLVSTSTLSTDSYNAITSSSTYQNVGGSAGSADGANVTVINKGAITTHGGYSTSKTDTTNDDDVALGGGIAILAQSIGGGGGDNTGSGAIGGIGGSGSSGGNGSDGATVIVKNYAALTTYGSEAHGIVAQSIGGGGGTGRNKSGFFIAVGGAGGSGGDGGDAYVYNNAEITTSGDYASGVIIQSIGGGGGAGGKASAWSIFTHISAAVGGSGGSGGDGGTATYEKTSGGSVSTSGDNATAIIVQSIGGGGGSGGTAKSHTYAVGWSFSFALGGSGGDGGNGGDAYAHVGGKIATSGTDSTGVLVQSIGGGGGEGGSSVAKSLAVGIPIDPEGNTFALSVATSQGGNAGNGGYGGTAKAWVEEGASITTTGDGAEGLVVQSIGGGGGNGGDSTAASGTATLASVVEKLSGGWAEFEKAAEDKSVTLNIENSIGGTGGSGGEGGFAYAHNLGTVTTSGDFATGILVQSIGGGGGNGGTGESSSLSLFGDSTFTLTYSVGGSGGTGSSGGTAKGGISDSGVIKTTGNNSAALIVQSIGGGGGIGAAGNGDVDADTTLNIGVGGTGGAGGDGGKAYAWNAGKITTSGDASSGVVVQSIGGGGGIGGSGTSSVSHSFGIEKELKKIESYGVTIKASLDIDTSLSGTVAASGGSGGNGGTVFFGLPEKDQTDFSYGTITTNGALSSGVIAQSIGAGGGSVSLSSNQSLELDAVISKDSTVSANLTLGSTSSETGGSGGAVYAYVSNVYTSGFSAIGVIAQSIGGGGGIAIMSGYAPSSLTFALGSSASAANESYGGKVEVTLLKGETIKTTGDNSSAIIAQSIGAGGGLAISALGTSATENDDTVADVISITLGSSSTQTYANTLNGGSVAVGSTGKIVTTGTRAIGIVAQSIGGGGGMLSASSTSISAVHFESSQQYASSDDVTVTLDDGASITTSGDGAAGIVAQSIAGGGGFAADLSSGRLYTNYISNSDSSYSYAGGSSAGTSGTVDVTVDDGASIYTTGAYAAGIIAQTIAGSGGIFEKNGKTYAGSLHRNSTSNTAAINITVDGAIKVTSEHSWGIWAQTQEGTTTVTVGSTGSIYGSSVSDDNGGAIHATFDEEGSFLLQTSSGGSVTGNVVTSKAGTESSSKDYSSTSSENADGAVSLAAAAPVGSSLMVNAGTFTTGVIAGLDTVLNSGIVNLGGEGNVIQTVFSGDLVGIGSSDYGSTYDAETLGLDTAFTAFTYNSRSTVKNWSTATSSSGGLISGLDVDMEGGTGDTLVVEGDFAG